MISAPSEASVHREAYHVNRHGIMSTKAMKATAFSSLLCGRGIWRYARLRETCRLMRNIRLKWNNFVTKHLRKVGIFRRLTISFLLLLLISALFLTFFSYYQYSKEINLNLYRYVSLLVQNVELKIRDILKEYEDDAVLFYGDSRIIGALAENASLFHENTEEAQKKFEENKTIVETMLYRMRENHKDIANIQFISPDCQYHMIEPSGYQRGGTIQDLDNFYKSGFYLLPQEKNGYPVWIDGKEQSSVFFKNGQHIYGIGNTITLSIAVYEPETRNFLGVLLFNIDLNTFSGAMEGYEAYNDGNVFLVGKDGILTWFNPSLSAPSFPSDPALFAEMIQKKQAVVKTREGSRSVLLAYEEIPGTQIFVAYIADWELLLQRTINIRNLCVTVLICIVIIGLLLSFYVTVSISDPVRQLVRVMDKAGDGKWEIRYSNSGNDEITLLGDHFNAMADRTNRLIEEVYLSEIKRQRAMLSWKNTQLDVLLMQINPHFLYNTLDIIRWEAMYEANGESAVTQMIEKFSKLCRLGMCGGGNTIPLSEGLEHASVYIEVINFRHSEKIVLNILVDVDEKNTYIPRFMLQPIMENAVVHAFEDAGKGRCIDISVGMDGCNLRITVKDNGRGMDEQKLSDVRSALAQNKIMEKSIGLVNVNQRIRLFYGEEYGISIFSDPGIGTRIQITLPLRKVSENMQAFEQEG